MVRLAALALLVVGCIVACGDNKLGHSPLDGGPGDEPDGGGEPIPIDRAHAGGNPGAIAVVDGKAFLGIGPRLTVWDLASGMLVGESAPLRGTIGAVAVVGTRAYVAERIDLDSKLHVLDISDLSAIGETGIVDLAPVGGGSVIRDIEPGPNNRLYVSDQEQGVFELDLADPDQPAQVRMAPQLGAGQLQLVGTRLYYFNSGFIGASLGAFDTTMALEDLGQSSLPVASVTVTGDLAVGAGESGIYVYDVKNIGNPIERYAFSNPDGGPFARAVVASGTRAWIPAHDGLHVLDLAMPAMVKRARFDHHVAGVNVAALAGATLAIATDRGDLQLFDVTAPAPANPRSFAVTLCADCIGVDVDGDTVYIADIVGGLRSAALANLAAVGRSPAIPPQQSDGLSVVFEDVEVDAERAYVADWLYGLRVYDVADPAAITAVGALDTAGAPSGVAVAGDRVVLSEGTGGGFVRAIDAGNPAMPVELGAIETAKSIDVEVRGNLAFVADEELFASGGLKIVDLTNPAKLVLLGTYNTDCANARDVALVGPFAIVACSFDGFHLVDISDPAQPARVAVVPAPAIASAWSVGAYAGHVVLGHDRGVIVASIANPGAPVEVASYPTAWAVRAIATPAPGRIVASCGLGGVYQWQQ